MKRKIVRLKKVQLYNIHNESTKNFKLLKAKEEKKLIDEGIKSSKNIVKPKLLSIEKSSIITDKEGSNNFDQKRPNTPRINFIDLKKKRPFQFRVPTTSTLFSNLDQKLVEYANKEEFHFDITAELLSEHIKMPMNQISQIKKIELKVDCEEQSLQRIGEILINVIELKLNNSIIKSIRDIGTSFKSLKILWISRVGLKDISGLTSLSEVEELYASFNFISDLFDFIYLSKLKILDLEGNNVKEIESLKYLVNNTNLISLNLISNPVSKYQEYTKKVKEQIPSLQYIDDININKGNVKIQSPLNENVEANKNKNEQNKDIIDNPKYDINMMKTLKDLGISEEQIIEESKSAEKIIQGELNEEEFLLSKIKSAKTDKIEINKAEHDSMFNSSLKLKGNPQKINSFHNNELNQGMKSMKILFVDPKKIRNSQKVSDPGGLLKNFNPNQVSFNQIVSAKLKINKNKILIDRKDTKETMYSSIEKNMSRPLTTEASNKVEFT